jgi:hypothetical protein
MNKGAGTNRKGVSILTAAFGAIATDRCVPVIRNITLKIYTFENENKFLTMYGTCILQKYAVKRTS